MRIVIPAQAGTPYLRYSGTGRNWAPACAGVTTECGVTTTDQAASCVIPSSIGNDGSRDHSFHEPKYILTFSYPASLSAR